MPKKQRKAKEKARKASEKAQKRPVLVCDVKDLAFLSFDARQSADLIEMAIKGKVRAQNQHKARMKRLDDPDAKKRMGSLSSQPVIKRLTNLRDQAAVDAYETVRQLPGYTFMMGTPGIQILLTCKLLGMIPMHGPHCLVCGEQNIPPVRNIVVCWPCQKIVEEKDYGKKCDSIVDDDRAPLGKRRCDRPYTRSKFSLQCPKCGHIQHDFPTFSMFRKYVGNCPGHQRLRRNQPAEYNQRLKMYMYQVFSCLLKVAGGVESKGRKPWHPERFYAEFYGNWRITYAERHGIGSTGQEWLEKLGIYDPKRFTGYKVYVDVKNEKTGKITKVPKPTDYHQNLMAKNKLLDVFQFHLWTCWRRDMDWPTERPYPVERLGHHTEYLPEEFSTVAVRERSEIQIETLRRAMNKGAESLPESNIEDEDDSV